MMRFAVLLSMSLIVFSVVACGDSSGEDNNDNQNNNVNSNDNQNNNQPPVGVPIAVDDAAETDEDASVIIDVLDNDHDPDGDSIAVESVTEPLFGSSVVQQDGQIQYTPPPYFNGTDVFDYTISDGVDGTAVATVTVTIAPIGEDYYVAVDGDDGNPGTLALPFATLQRARTAIRDLKSGGALPPGGVVIWLRGGIHQRLEAFLLETQDSGEADRPVVFAGYPGEDARLVSGAQIDPADFTLVDSTSPYWSRLDPSAQGNLYQVDLGAQAFGSHPELLWSIRSRGFIDRRIAALELIFNGERMQLGRWPDPGQEESGWVRSVLAVSDNQFTYAGNRPERWTQADQVWFAGFWKYFWADFVVYATEINTSTKTVTLGRNPYFGIGGNRPYFAFNLIEEITLPGEWYLDRNTGILFFWPPTALTGSEILVSVTEEPAVRLDNTSWITFREVSFEGGRRHLIEIDGGQYNTLQRCRLLNSGGTAVTIDGAHNGLERCEVAYSGGGGADIFGGNRTSLTAGSNFVRNSHFHHFAERAYSGNSGITLNGVGHLIEHNLIHDGPHEAVKIYTGNNHRVAFNDIHHVCRLADDAGAVYSGRDWGFRGNVIEYNFIHHISSDFSDGWGVHGVYLDDCVSGFSVFGNILYEIASAGILNGGGRDNIMRNNIIVGANIALFSDGRGGNSITTGGGSWDLLQKISNVNYWQEPWASAYPALAAIPNDWSQIVGTTWLCPGGSVFSHNLAFDTGSWITGYDWGCVNHLDSFASTSPSIEDADPLFVDEAGGDFSLQPNSPAFTLPGFVDIPFHQIGIQP